MAELNKAKYTAKENAKMSERRKQINEMSSQEIMDEWDKVTGKICKKFGLKRKEVKKDE